MTMIDQKIVEPPERGDCMIACIATCLGDEYGPEYDHLHTQINAIVERRGDWFSYVEAFAIGKGYRMRFDTVPDAVPPGYMTVAGGKSPRGCKAGHAVVFCGASELIHDPHPSRLGLVGDAEDWMWFEKIE